MSRPAVVGRLLTWLRCVLVSLDQLAHILLAGPKFILLGGAVPNPDETISSKVGRMAIRGKRWALIAEAAIDWLFCRLGAEPHHCRRMIEILPPYV